MDKGFGKILQFPGYEPGAVDNGQEMVPVGARADRERDIVESYEVADQIEKFHDHLTAVLGSFESTGNPDEDVENLKRELNLPKKFKNRTFTETENFLYKVLLGRAGDLESEGDPSKQALVQALTSIALEHHIEKEKKAAA